MSARISSGTAVVLSALIAASCTSRVKETTRDPGATTTTVGDTGSSEEPRPEQLATPIAFSPGVGPLAGGGMLLPPAAGQSRIALEGCLASPSTEEAGAKFPERPQMRSKGPPPVTVGISGLGVFVTHELSHPCCLKAEVTPVIENGIVTVTEKLSGTACRCMCSSKIKTAVGLSPGSYELSVRLQTADGATSDVHHQQVEIKRIGQ